MYLTVEEYEEITGKDATESDIEQACMLLDARLGNRRTRRGKAQHKHKDKHKRWILSMDHLYKYQQQAVKQWVAHMTTYIVENDGLAPSIDNVSLGRFSVSDGSGDHSSALIPTELKYADSVLISSGLIVRRAGLA